MAESPKQRVSQNRIRSLYTQHFEERITSGAYVLSERSRTRKFFSDLPEGAASVMYDILPAPGAQRIGVVHAIVLPDGSLGGGGKYDPKALEVEGIFFILDKNITD